MFNNVTNAHAGARCVLRSISARAFLYFPCALYVYACTSLFTRVRVPPSMPPLSVQLRHNDDDDSFLLSLSRIEIRPRSFAFPSA